MSRSKRNRNQRRKWKDYRWVHEVRRLPTKTVTTLVGQNQSVQFFENFDTIISGLSNWGGQNKELIFDRIEVQLEAGSDDAFAMLPFLIETDEDAGPNGNNDLDKSLEDLLDSALGDSSYEYEPLIQPNRSLIPARQLESGAWFLTFRKDITSYVNRRRKQQEAGNAATDLFTGFFLSMNQLKSVAVDCRVHFVGHEITGKAPFSLIAN